MCDQVLTRWMLKEDKDGFGITAYEEPILLSTKKSNIVWEKIQLNAAGNFRVRKYLTVEIYIDPITLKGFKFTTKGERNYKFGKRNSPMSIDNDKGLFSMPHIRDGGNYLVVKYLGGNPSNLEAVQIFAYDMTIIGETSEGNIRGVHIDPVITNDGCVGCG